MANPQTEKGHVRIANDLFDALCRTPMRDEARRVLLAIIRLTYGYNKKGDAISLSQIAEAAGILSRHVARSLIYLKSRNIIHRDKNSYTQLNKDYDTWSSQSPTRDSPTGDVPNEGLASPQPGADTSPQPGGYHIQKTFTKDSGRPVDTFLTNQTNPDPEREKQVAELCFKAAGLSSDSEGWYDVLGRLQILGMVPRLGGDVAIFKEGRWRVKGGQGWVDWADAIKGNLRFVKGNAGGGFMNPKRATVDAPGQD